MKSTTESNRIPGKPGDEQTTQISAEPITKMTRGLFEPSTTELTKSSRSPKKEGMPGSSAGTPSSIFSSLVTKATEKPDVSNPRVTARSTTTDQLFSTKVSTSAENPISQETTTQPLERQASTLSTSPSIRPTISITGASATTTKSEATITLSKGSVTPTVNIDGGINTNVTTPGDVNMPVLSSVSTQRETTSTSVTSSPSKHFSIMPSSPGIAPETVESSTTTEEAIVSRVPSEKGQMLTSLQVNETTTPENNLSSASTHPSFPTLISFPASSSFKTVPISKTSSIPTRRPFTPISPRRSSHKQFQSISTSTTSHSPPKITLQRIFTPAPSIAPSTLPSSTSAPESTPSMPPLDPTDFPDFPESGLKTTTEDDLSVVIESFESTTEFPNDLAPGKRGRCTSSDRSMCHELAICEIATGACRCKDGFTGDGYTNCT
ncbi:unnamed protein product [Strongylus vulgaris]|uniref:EGF-like domain-containing protein n=1 Tax=Strongylus vulgaris TaxID=40348 RepID=A0A3P7ILQ8_STRVU|nr:unnamed protein product [Strongylus vulgaris]